MRKVGRSLAQRPAFVFGAFLLAPSQWTWAHREVRTAGEKRHVPELRRLAVRSLRRRRRRRRDGVTGRARRRLAAQRRPRSRPARPPGRLLHQDVRRSLRPAHPRLHAARGDRPALPDPDRSQHDPRDGVSGFGRLGRLCLRHRGHRRPLDRAGGGAGGSPDELEAIDLASYSTVTEPTASALLRLVRQEIAVPLHLLRPEHPRLDLQPDSFSTSGGGRSPSSCPMRRW